MQAFNSVQEVRAALSVRANQYTKDSEIEECLYANEGEFDIEFQEAYAEWASAQ